MTCTSPVPCFQQNIPNENGKRPISHKPYPGYTAMMRPCNQCYDCRLGHARQWAVRSVHEASLYNQGEDCVFITATFSDDALRARRSDDGKPVDPNTLQKRDMQLFWKRLRRHNAGINEVASINDNGQTIYHNPIRYLAAGEYGSKCRTCGIKERYHKSQGCSHYQPGRPHYHALIFNWRPPDGQIYSDRGLHPIYSSQRLSDAWDDQGLILYGDVTFESAGYVARYCLKKRNGAEAWDRYTYTDFDTGEFKRILPEYNAASNRGGIGKRWYEKFKSDCYPHDYVVMKGQKMRVPKYYDRLLEHEDPLALEQLKERRKLQAELYSVDQSDQRLKARGEFRKRVIEEKLNCYRD